MSSIHSYPAQPAPFTFYVAGANANYLTVDINGALTNITASVAAGTVFADMGKTVVPSGGPFVYRKVKVVTLANGTAIDGAVGYICLNNNDLGAVNQNINKLN